MAERSYRDACEMEPEHGAANERLGDVLRDRSQFDDAVDCYRRALKTDPGRHGSHKGLIDALLGRDGVEAAFDAYGLTGDAEAISSVEDVLACTVVRNERFQLDDFLAHHRALGVTRFLFVDNGSTDGTVEFLNAQSDVSLLNGKGSFQAVKFGSAWFELALRRWRPNGWTLLIDADERFVHPIDEHAKLHELVTWLDGCQHRGMTAVLLDMYGPGPVADTFFVEGSPFVEVCPYFDVPFFHREVPKAGPYRNARIFEGGMRTRVFGDASPLLSKVPLVKYGPEVVLTGGQHFTNIPDEGLSPARAALLHMKYSAGLFGRASIEIARGEHYDNAGFYRPIVSRLTTEPNLSFYTPGVSVRYCDAESLLNAGVLCR